FVVFDFQGWLLGVLTAPFAKIPHRKLFAFTLIGRFFSLFLPSSIGGDVIKGIYLFPYFERRSQAFAAIVMQRGVGGLSTLLIALVAGYVYLPEPYRNSILIISLVFALTGVAMLTLYYRYKRYLWDRIKLLSEPAGSPSGAFS